MPSPYLDLVYETHQDLLCRLQTLVSDNSLVRICWENSFHGVPEDSRDMWTVYVSDDVGGMRLVNNFHWSDKSLETAIARAIYYYTSIA